MTDSSWQVFDVDALRRTLAEDRPQYKEFLNVPALTCGVYRLPAGAKDMQSHHDEDEVYFVLEGCARLRVGDEEKRVSAGNVLYVKATESHSFFEIEEDMTLLVFFAAEV